MGEGSCRAEEISKLWTLNMGLSGIMPLQEPVWLLPCCLLLTHYGQSLTLPKLSTKLLHGFVKGVSWINQYCLLIFVKVVASIYPSCYIICFSLPNVNKLKLNQDFWAYWTWNWSDIEEAAVKSVFLSDLISIIALPCQWVTPQSLLLLNFVQIKFVKVVAWISLNCQSKYSMPWVRRTFGNVLLNGNKRERISS